MKYLVGLGNYSMGDDSIGLRIVEHIIENNLEHNFSAISLSNQPLNLLSYLNKNTKKIVIIDTLKANKTPGTLTQFTPNDVESIKTQSGFSTHEGDLLKTLNLAQQMGYHIPKVVILGIEPQAMDQTMTLSKTLEEKFIFYVNTAIAEIEKD